MERNPRTTVWRLALSCERQRRIGMESLRELKIANRDKAAPTDALLRALLERAGSGVHDDVALLMMQRE